MEDSGYCGPRMLYLRALAVILVLARELLAFEAVKHLADGLRRLRKHGLKRYARRELAPLLQPIDADLEQGRDHEVVRRKFAADAESAGAQRVQAGYSPVDRLDDLGGVLEACGEPLCVQLLSR